MTQQKTKAFTLVELIVVITILAILGTIAFISLQGYSRDARDSTRVSDIGNIKTSLELFSLAVGKYPLPDNYYTVTYSGDDVRHQGLVGDNVTTNLQNLNEKPIDPLYGIEYTYSVTDSKKEYEVLALYEGDGVANTNIVPQTHAAGDVVIPKIDGTYNQVYVKTKNFIVPIPSIISGTLTGSMELGQGNINNQVITNGPNIPSIGGNEAQTGTLNLTFSATGTITENSTALEKLSVIEAIQTTYSGSNLETNDNIFPILSAITPQDQLSLINNIIFDGKYETSNSSIDGECGSDNGQEMLIEPTNLCNIGEASVLSGTGPWDWTCDGIDGGLPATCNTTFPPAPASCLWGESMNYQIASGNSSTIASNISNYIGCSIPDYPGGGGYIFGVGPTYGNVLLVSNIDDSNGAAQWGYYGIVTDARDNNDGYLNTTKINDYPTRAGGICWFKGGTTGVWYLPAKNELIAFYNSGIVSNSSMYRSSTEYLSSQSYTLYFGNGNVGANGKDINYSVRCITGL